MQGEETVTQLEVQAIVSATVEKALDEQTDKLPELMKPVMYEVAEKVSRRSEDAIRQMLGALFGVNLVDNEAVRKFQMDLFWLRERREASDRAAAAFKSSVVFGGLKAVGIILLCVLLSVLASAGLKVGGI